MYVEPLYIQAENIAFPELKQVIVADAKRVVMKGDLQSALDALVTKEVENPYASTNGSSPHKNIEDVRQAFSEVQQTLNELEMALDDLLASSKKGEQ